MPPQDSRVTRFVGILALCAFAGCGGSVVGSADSATDSGSSDAATDSVVDSALDAPKPATACRAASDCVLTSVTCCGVCGSPTERDVIALHKLELPAYRAGLCADPVACPGCASMPEPNLVADCRAEKCVVVDIRKDPVSACRKDSDCRVRTSTCCECGGGPPYVAVSAVSRGYEKLVCAPDTACAECMPLPPTDVSAVCDPKTAHCTLRSGA